MSEIGVVGCMCVFMPVLQHQLPARGPQHCRLLCSNVRAGWDFEKLAWCSFP